jgi:hypothetical protein
MTTTYSVADVRQFVLMAADKIERFPKQFDFWMCSVPSSPNDCGCALGWIGYFAGRRLEPVGRASEELLGFDSAVFYDRMDGMNARWAYSSSVCAKALRLYADTYLADTRRPTVARGEAA